MKEITHYEQQLLAGTCKKYDLSYKMVNSMLKTASQNAYENKSSSVRKKELLDLIEFHLKNQKDV